MPIQENNIQELLIISSTEKNDSSQLPIKNQKRLYKSEYVKAHFNTNNDNKESLTTSEEGSQGDSYLPITTTIAATNNLTKKELYRYSDGFFMRTNNQNNDRQSQQKQFLKLSLVGLQGCGYSPVENRKTSLFEGETYKEFNTEYIKTGYGFIIDYLFQIWNIFMNLFSNLMKYFGKILTTLEKKYSSGNLGYAMMAISTVLHLIPTLYVKCNPQIDYSVSLMTRGIITMFLMLCMGRVKNQAIISFCKNDMIILIVRGFLTALSQLYFFYAVNKLPLSINYVIFNTGPIFVFLLSSLLFGIIIKKKEIIGIIISISGVLCITNPDLILGLFYESNKTTNEVQEIKTNVQPKFQYAEGQEKLIIILTFVILYIGWAYGILIVKKIKEANTYAMNFYVALACFLSGAFSFYMRDQSISHLGLSDFAGLIFIVGLFCFGSQYTFITSTFLNNNHGPLSMLNYLSVVESYVVQIIFFNEVPSTTEMSGSLLVLVGLTTILIKS